jgi:hypothetical protein
MSAVSYALALALESALTIGNEQKPEELLGLIECIPPGETTPFVRAVGARLAAHRAALGCDDEPASAGFRRGCAHLPRDRKPFELAYVLLEHALLGEGLTEKAQPLAAEAGEIFKRLRAILYPERLASPAALS